LLQTSGVFTPFTVPWQALKRCNSQLLPKAGIWKLIKTAGIHSPLEWERGAWKRSTEVELSREKLLLLSVLVVLWGI
jgi:hypothetical protein